MTVAAALCRCLFKKTNRKHNDSAEIVLIDVCCCLVCSLVQADGTAPKKRKKKK